MAAREELVVGPLRRGDPQHVERGRREEGGEGGEGPEHVCFGGALCGGDVEEGGDDVGAEPERADAHEGDVQPDVRDRVSDGGDGGETCEGEDTGVPVLWACGL